MAANLATRRLGELGLWPSIRHLGLTLLCAYINEHALRAHRIPCSGRYCIVSAAVPPEPGHPHLWTAVHSRGQCQGQGYMQLAEDHVTRHRAPGLMKGGNRAVICHERSPVSLLYPRQA